MGSRNETLRAPLKAWKFWTILPREYPKISELPFQKISWEIKDMNRNFVILEIINSISSLKNEQISFVLLIKLWTVCTMLIKFIT